MPASNGISFPMAFLPFALDQIPMPAYLVGGAVRDWLLQQQHPARGLRSHEAKLDLDLVLERSPLVWAERLAHQLGAGFVVLDPEREIARIVLAEATVDVALQSGATLETDLRQRDFTCNAIALEIHSGVWIDPLQGYADIERHCIRMVDPDNLSADPLRLLRAYRQAAQLNFAVDLETREAIRQRHQLLADVAAERIRTEISYLLSTGMVGLDWLQQAWQDRLLDGWLPELTAAGFTWAQRVLGWAPRLQRLYPRSYAILDQTLTDQRSLQICILLASLLSPESGVEQLDHRLKVLKYSRAEWQTTEKLHELVPRILALGKDPTAVQMYSFFRAAGDLLPAVGLLAATQTTDSLDLDPWLSRYENPQDRLAHPAMLLDGRQLMQALNLKPGPQVGRILEQVQQAYAIGELDTSEQALAYARQWQQPDHLNPSPLEY
ncbi:MAG: CCA tRNA nucleotidyltransferase [Synechococcaceae cyanobacterium SM2_3_1]|nr:CCA tRNA nucleotidyltransferase [Synechococcaceae cyanobacterium SM2_3_1]